MATIRAIIELIIGLMRAFRLWQSAEDARLAKEAEEKRQAREKAIEELEKAIEADDEEAIFQAQQKLIRNKP